MKYFGSYQPPAPPLKVTDRKLRAHGFRIHDRPANGKNVWERGGHKYTEAEAVEIVRKESH